MPTRPMDEDTYPRLYFTRQQLDVIALAREIRPTPLRTKVVAEHFGWSFTKAYKVLRRLRAKGVFVSQLMWVTGKGGIHSPGRGPNGEAILYSWLELYLQPIDEWGNGPDEVQARFRPVKGGT